MDNKNTFASNLKKYMNLHGKSRREVSEALNVSYYTFSDWVNGKKYPRMDKVEMLANYFGILKSDLIEAKPRSIDLSAYGFEPVPPMSRLPIVGSIACGEPILAEQNIEGYATVPEDWRATFILRCKGDSMAPVILEGDIVAIRRQDTVDNGQIAAVRIGDEATLKRVFLHDDYIELRPENSAYRSIIRKHDDLNDIHIEGIAVGFCRSL